MFLSPGDSDWQHAERQEGLPGGRWGRQRQVGVPELLWGLGASRKPAELATQLAGELSGPSFLHTRESHSLWSQPVSKHFSRSGLAVLFLCAFIPQECIDTNIKTPVKNNDLDCLGKSIKYYEEPQFVFQWTLKFYQRLFLFCGGGWSFLLLSGDCAPLWPANILKDAFSSPAPSWPAGVSRLHFKKKKRAYSQDFWFFSFPSRCKTNSRCMKKRFWVWNC